MREYVGECDHKWIGSESCPECGPVVAFTRTPKGTQLVIPESIFSLSEMAEETGMSLEAVQAALEELEDYGLVRVTG